MKIKGGRARTYNFKFGAALLFVIIMLVLSLYLLATERVRSKNVQESLDTSALANLLFKPELIELQVNDEEFAKIKIKREEALQKGLLFTSKADLVPADIRISNHLFPANIRLKGDLVDHLKEDKLSYRIELKNGEQWRDMSVFSVHNSGARSHLAEWYMHQLFKMEDIMSTQYDFVELNENGKHRGVYAYEEHFTDQLLVSHNKPIGPILKHNDDAYWNNIQKDVKPFYWTKAAEIDLFNANHKGDVGFMKSYEYGKSLLNGFLNSELTATVAFDIDKMAKYYALMELSHGFHSQQITNIRFYFNPLTAKLEPIAFDCFGTELPAVTQGWAAAGEGINSKTKPLEGYPYGGVYMHLLFQDRDFFERYMTYLYRYSKRDYLDKLNGQLDQYTKERETFIQTDQEYNGYQFSFDELFKKAALTRKKILPLPDYSIKIFTTYNSRRNLIVQSFHYFPFKIVGFGKDGKLLDALQEEIYLEAYNEGTEQSLYEVNNKYGHDELFFQVVGIDSMFSTQIMLNDFPQSPKRSKEASLSDLRHKYSIEIIDNNLSFENEYINIDEPLIIPKGLIVIFKAGQSIQFSNRGCLITHSPIRAIGNQNTPIKFSGKAKKGQGLLIINDDDKPSVFDYCYFDGLHSVQHQGIDASAGLTISSEIDMSNSLFKNMPGQSALSIIKGDAQIQNVEFKDCAGDAMRCDYISGTLTSVHFDSIAGDAIAAQYSKLNILNSQFNHISGEAIKGFKMEKLELADINIENSFEGIGIKQSSAITIQNIEFNNLHNAIHIEGSQNYLSNVSCSDMHFKNIQNKYVLDQFSTLLVNNKKVF